MKKETKKVTKKTVKKTVIKPKFIVDLTKAETCEDIKFEFIKAKATQGVAVTEEDILFLVNLGAEIALKYIDMCIEEINKKATQPKKPWYKRFWGWLTKPFKKNK